MSLPSESSAEVAERERDRKLSPPRCHVVQRRRRDETPRDKYTSTYGVPLADGSTKMLDMFESDAIPGIAMTFCLASTC